MHTSLSEAFFFHRWRMLLFRIQVPALKIFVHTKKYLSCLLPDLAGSAGHLAVLNSPDPYSTPLLEPRLGPNIHLPFFLSKKRNIA